MLTQDNTEGYSQEELDKMNEEVEEIMQEWLKPIEVDLDYYQYLKWAEHEVLKKYRGA